MRALLLTLTLYYGLTTTVYPWYITSLVVAVFMQSRYSLLWAGVVWLSYSAYQVRPYEENKWFALLEYALFIGFAGWEWIVKGREY